MHTSTRNEAYKLRVEKNMQAFGALSASLIKGKQHEYVEAAKKLAKWLESERAYYLEARKPIVEMLEAASEPLVRALNLTPGQAFHISMCTSEIQNQAVAYTTLVRMVQPHLHRFPDQLNVRLVNVLSTISRSSNSQSGSSTSQLVSPSESAMPINSARTGSKPTNDPDPTASTQGDQSRRTSINTQYASPLNLSPVEGPVNTVIEEAQYSLSVLPHRRTKSNGTFTTPQAALPAYSRPSASQKPGSSTPDSPLEPVAQPPPTNRLPSVTQPAAQTPPIAAPTTSTKLGKAVVSKPMAKRASFPSKFMQFAELDLKSFKRVLSQPKMEQQNEDKGDHPLQSPTTASQNESEHLELPSSTNPTVPSKEISDVKDKDNAGPLAQNGPAASDIPQNRAESSATPSLRAEPIQSDKRPQTEVDLPSVTPDEPTPILSTLGSRLEDKPPVFEPLAQLPNREDEEQIKSPSASILPRLNSTTQSPSQYVSQLNSTDPIQDRTSETLGKIDHVVEPSQTVPTPNLTTDTKTLVSKTSGDPEHVVPNPNDHTETIQSQPPADAHIPNQEDRSSTREPDDMATPLASPTSQGAVQITGESFQDEPSDSSTIAPQRSQSPDTPGKTQDQLSAGKLSDEHAETSTPERETVNVDSHSDSIGVLQLSGVPVMRPGSASNISMSGGAVMRESSLESVEKETNSIFPLDSAPSDVPPHPEVQVHPDDQPPVQARENVSFQEHAQNAAAGPSNSGERTDHLTNGAKHFLRAQSEENQQHRAPNFVRNMEKIILSLPKEKVEGLIQLAESNALSYRATSPTEDTAGVGGPRTNRDISASLGAGRGTKKRHRSESLDQATSSAEPSSRPRREDMVPYRAETGDSIDNLASAQPTPSTSPRQADDMALADASNLAPRAESPQALINTRDDDGISEKENTPKHTKEPQRVSSSSSSAAPHNDEYQDARDDRPVLGLLSYHPIIPFEIVALVEGSSSPDVHEVNLELEEHQSVMVKRWNDRFNNYDRTAPCIAITLICSRLAEVEGWSEQNPGTSAEEATRNMQIQWPADGGLWITIQADSAEPVSLPLSPPASIKSHEPLDLSPSIGPRTNNIRLIQTTDLSDFVFVIRAHRPTEAQLHEFHEANIKQMAWHDSLARLSVPFSPSLPINIFPTLRSATTFK